MSPRPLRPPARRHTRAEWPTSLVPIAAGLLALVGIGLLWTSWSGEPAGGGSGIRPGEVGVPVAALDLPAYTELQLEHLLDPRTGELAAVFLPEESILDSTIVEPAQLVGRVLARPKAARGIFREQDFLPVGTRPGLVAGIPVGKRALRIDASRVSGIVGLQQGDRFDLVATYPGQTGAGRIESVYGASGALDSRSNARARTVAENAAVVTALETRQLPAGGRSGAVVQEMVIALDPREVAIVAEALEVAKRIDCIPRSGLPGENETHAATDTGNGERAEGSPATRGRPGDEPVIDMIEGSRRALRRVPLGGPSHTPFAVGAGPGYAQPRIEGGEGGR